MSIRRVPLLAALLLPCLLASAADVPEGGLPTAALIDRAGGAAAALVEARLLDDPRAAWVERNEIKRVLEERNLDAAFGAGGHKERLALGEQLKADLLVMLRRVDPPDGKGQPLLECMVCETGRGLRLRMASARDVAEESTVETCLEAFAGGVRKEREAIREIVAVPPFMSDDLGRQRNHLQSAYARLVERALLDQPGIVVVELDEAESLAREEALAAKDRGVRRERLPMYVLGRYRHSGAGGATRVAVEVELRHGDASVGRRDGMDLEPDAVAGWLADAALALLGGTGSVAATPVDPREEARQLAARAREFVRVGHWAEARDLFEASLLLDPQPVDVRRDAVIAYGNAVEPWTGQPSAADIAATVARYRRGLEHLEAFVRTAGDLDVDHATWQLERWMIRDRPDLAPFNAEPVRTLIRELETERRDTYLRIARFRSAAGLKYGKWLLLALHRLSADEQHALAARLLEEHADAPDFAELADSMLTRCVDRRAPTFKQLLVALSRSESEHVRHAAERARRTLAEEAAAVAEATEKMQPVEAPRVTDVADEIVPTPIEFTFVGGAPADPEICGCLPAGPGRDVFFGFRSLYVMRRRGELEPLWSAADEHVEVGELAFDGRFLWMTSKYSMGPAKLLVVNPENGSAVAVTADDGLPMGDGTEGGLFPVVRVAPLDPGRVCLAGAVGRRGWVGVATFDGTRAAVRIFYEARESGHTADERQADGTAVGFWPSMATAFSARDDQGNRVQQVLVPRVSENPAAGERPLLIDVARERVRVADFRFLAEGETGEGRPEAATAVIDGTLMIEQFDGDRGIPLLIGVSAIAGSVSTLYEDQPEGRYAVQGRELHILGTQWSVFDTEARKLRLAASPVPWVFKNRWCRKGDASPPLKLRPNDLTLHSVHASNHYGVVASTRTLDWKFRLFAGERRQGGPKADSATSREDD